MKSQQEILSQRPCKPWKRCDLLKINSLGNTKRRLHEQIMIGRTRRYSLRFPHWGETFFHLSPAHVVNEKEKYCPFLFLIRYMAKKNIRDRIAWFCWLDISSSHTNLGNCRICFRLREVGFCSWDPPLGGTGGGDFFPSLFHISSIRLQICTCKSVCPS